eukprot:5313853-Prymnesium_polylepis.1
MNLQDPRDRRNEHALARNARKRTAPRPGGAPDSKGSGDDSNGVVQSSDEKSGRAGGGGLSPRPGSVMRGCERGG